MACYEAGLIKLLLYKLGKQQTDATINKTIRYDAPRLNAAQTTSTSMMFRNYYEELYSQPKTDNKEERKCFLVFSDSPTISWLKPHGSRTGGPHGGTSFTEDIPNLYQIRNGALKKEDFRNHESTL